MSDETDQPIPLTFDDLELPDHVLRALSDVGYEQPSPIQAATIPTLLSGRDVIGQAQTGTGKTAAFALPIVSIIDVKKRATQALVLAPTRELAIQVSEAFQRYASGLKHFHVIPVYGGQSMDVQLRKLKRGAHVIVGTPGRIMDHMRRGTIKLDSLQHLVIDEADEMLRMGFIEDVEWILERTPETRQIALFSATMPPAVRRIADRFLNTPETITIERKMTAAETVRQRFWKISNVHKLDALTRILEAEAFEGVIVFVRTKTATTQLAEKLEARGFATEALNGDMAQKQRELTVGRLKSGKLDILVATDVAARGLDVERVSHVVNFDIPYDAEAYVHRIGRTGRAGRTGEAILFVAPRETRMLRTIENAIGNKLEPLSLPTTQDVNDRRIARFKERIAETLANETLGPFKEIVGEFLEETETPLIEVAAALARMSQGDRPLLLTAPVEKPGKRKDHHKDRRERREEDARTGNAGKHRDDRGGDRRPPGDVDWAEYTIQVGHKDGVRPGDIVGALARAAGMDSRYIGKIDIQPTFTRIQLPAVLPSAFFRTVKKVRVRRRLLKISKVK